MSAEEATGIARAAERLRRGTRLPLKVLLPTAAALGAGGALAAAAIPGSNGVITACYNTSTSMSVITTTDNGQEENDVLEPQYGTLRVIDPDANPVTDTVLGDDDTTTTANAYVNACAPNEQTITWNQQGPMGPAGAAGKNGTDGTNGANGTNGAAGTNGANGANGAAGANGANGSNGSIDGAATFEIDTGSGTELFAKLAQIAGTSKLDGQSGLIPLQAFAFGAESPVLNTGKGARIGAQTVQTFELVKKDDNTDSTLFQDWQQGKTISTMTVQADHVAKGKTGEAATFTFADVKLKSIQQKDGAETIVGVFTKMHSSFGSGNSKVGGSLNPGATTSWDLSEAQSS